MKRKIYLLAIALFATLYGNASSLYMRFTQHADYTIVIDGYYYQVNGSDFTLPTLRSGCHQMVIESYPVYHSHNRRAMPIVIFNGNLQVKEASDIFASVDGYGFHIDRILQHNITNRHRRPFHYQYNEQRCQFDEIEDEDARSNYNYYNNKGSDYDNSRDYDNQSGENKRRSQENGRVKGEYRTENQYVHYMNNGDFEVLKKSISGTAFDSSKRAFAMSGISSNNLSITQLKEILSLINFESTRLEIAKYAYNFSNDKGRYFELTDAFIFDSSKQEILELGKSR